MLDPLREPREFGLALLRQSADGVLPSRGRSAVRLRRGLEPRLADRCDGTADPVRELLVGHGAKEKVGGVLEFHRSKVYAVGLTRARMQCKLHEASSRDNSFDVSSAL